jgi:predicted ferric reductase
MLIFLLSTKNRLIVKWFGGLESVYFWHRTLSILTVAFIFVHATFADDHGLIILSRYLKFGVEPDDLGELSRNLFLVIIGTSIFAKIFKYEHFKYIHRLMIIPYVLGLYHGFALSWVDLLSFDYLSIWMITTSLVGISSSLYMMLFYVHIGINQKGIIETKTILNSHTLELKVKMQASYRFQAGQFCFIKINHPSIDKHPHPFSISGVEDDYIYFTIKTLGDYTQKLYDNLNVPARINLSKPFGHMTFNASKPQVWIGGGVGITPFLGKIRNHHPITQETHLYYSARSIEDAVHLETFKKYEQQNPLFHFHFINQQTDGFLTAENIDLSQYPHIYMCGPKPMVDSINKQLKAKNNKLDITFEAFDFTGLLVNKIVRYISQFMKKLKKVYH